MVKRYVLVKDCNNEEVITLSSQEAEYDILFFFLLVNIHLIRDIDSTKPIIIKPFDTEVVRLRVSKDYFLKEYKKHKIGLQLKGLVW